MRSRSLLAALVVVTLLAAACGSGVESVADTEGCDPLPLKVDGTLRVATGETVFPPWMGAGDDDFDDPSTEPAMRGPWYSRWLRSSVWATTSPSCGPVSMK